MDGGVAARAFRGQSSLSPVRKPAPTRFINIQSFHTTTSITMAVSMKRGSSHHNDGSSSALTQSHMSRRGFSRSGGLFSKNAGLARSTKSCRTSSPVDQRICGCLVAKGSILHVCTCHLIGHSYGGTHHLRQLIANGHSPQWIVRIPSACQVADPLTRLRSDFKPCQHPHAAKDRCGDNRRHYGRRGWALSDTGARTTTPRQLPSV